VVKTKFRAVFTGALGSFTPVRTRLGETKQVRVVREKKECECECECECEQIERDKRRRRTRPRLSSCNNTIIYIHIYYNIYYNIHTYIL
jgi:hypothetical protein